MRKAGAPEEVIEATLKRETESEGPDFELWPENLSIWHCWTGLSTQWRMGFIGMEGRVIYHGLDYQAAEIVIRRYGYQDEADEVFQGLQTMEAAALPILNKH